jgi:hypothetical protein
MPGKGKYTVYNTNNSSKKEHLSRLFSGTPGSTNPPFLGKNSEEALAEAVEIGNNILRARSTDGIISTGDPAWGTEGGKVDTAYRGLYASSTPPTGDFQPTRPGDPMNAFIPDISSPGAGKSGENASEIGEVRVEGTDKLEERNPKLTPSEYLGTRGKSFVPTQGTQQPGNLGSTIFDKNVLGPENKFDTTRPRQFSDE